MPDVSIIIAWRDTGNSERQASLTCVLDHLAPLGLPMILASDERADGSPFNRSAAYNQGMRLSPSEVYVFHEADMLCPHDQLIAGVALAGEGLGLVIPFTTYRYMGIEESRFILSGVDPMEFAPWFEMRHGRSIGAIGILSAESMRWVGQWDENLSGHGFDDNAMYHAIDTACGPARYVDGDASHLYHPMAYAPWERTSDAANPANFSPAEVKATEENRRRVGLYEAATTPEQVRALTGAPWPGEVEHG